MNELQLRERWEDEINAAHDRMADELPGMLTRRDVFEFLTVVLDDAAYEADFPKDVSCIDWRSPWMHAAATLLVKRAQQIIEDEQRVTKTRYQIAESK